jgi:hypothetical protein
MVLVVLDDQDARRHLPSIEPGAPARYRPHARVAATSAARMLADGLAVVVLDAVQSSLGVRMGVYRAVASGGVGNRCAASTPTSDAGCGPWAPHHWKRQRTSARRFGALSVKPQHAWAPGLRRQEVDVALSHAPAVDHGLRNAYFAARGLTSMAALHRYQRLADHAPAHPTMALEPG